ncbi:MAG: hypothetical protein ACRDOE_21215, partial [Streptosporangiaceae bacterium]
MRGPLANTQWVAPVALFWLVTIAAGLCWLASGALIIVAWRRAFAELAILGAALGMQSALGFVHGLTVPGIVYGPNNAVLTAAFLALPAALVVAVPALVRQTSAGVVLGRHWRRWTVGWTVGALGFCALLLARPDVLAAPTMGTPVPVVIGVVSLGAALGLSVRQLHLYWMGRLRASLVASLAFLWLGLSGLVWLGRGPFSLGFWTAHVLDIGGVATAALALVLGYRSNRSIVTVMTPVLTRDPLVALDLGLSPVAHRFVAMLALKD